MSHGKSLWSTWGKVGLYVSFTLTTAAHADIVTPVSTGGSLVSPFSSTASSSVPNPLTETGDGSNDGMGPVSVSDVSNNSAGSYTFNHTFAANTSSFGSINGNGTTYNFVDTYVIDIPAASVDSYDFSLNLTSQVSMSNLSARLYSYSANGVTNLTIGGTGAVNGTVYGSWSPSVNGGTVDSTLLTTATPTSGEYVLQIIGLETGTANGTYNGTLTVTPVPLPASLPLLLAGLGGFGLLRRRKKAFEA